LYPFDLSQKSRLINETAEVIHVQVPYSSPPAPGAKKSPPVDATETRQPHPRQRANYLDRQNENRMDRLDARDAGEVFVIPDLYCPSKLLIDASQNPSFLFSELKLDGL
jgi:hypothetical protein